MSVVNVVAIVTPVPGKEAVIEEILVELAAKVHAREGDVQRYQPYKQVGGAEGEMVFVVVERYKNQEALTAHMSTDYFTEIGKRIGDEGLLAKPLNIMTLAPLSTGFDGR